MLQVKLLVKVKLLVLLACLIDLSTEQLLEHFGRNARILAQTLECLVLDLAYFEVECERFLLFSQFPLRLLDIYVFLRSLPIPVLFLQLLRILILKKRSLLHRSNAAGLPLRHLLQRWLVAHCQDAVALVREGLLVGIGTETEGHARREAALVHLGRDGVDLVEVLL